jgi:hypothetical protein
MAISSPIARGGGYSHGGITPVVCGLAGMAEDRAAVTGISIDRLRVIHNPIVSGELLTAARDELEHPWRQGGQPPGYPTAHYFQVLFLGSELP